MILCYVYLGFVALWFIVRTIVRCIKEHGRKIDEFVKLDEKIKQNITDSCHEIDCFYFEEPKVEKLLKTNVLFNRKVQLLGRINIEKDLKDVVVVFTTGLISALLTKVLDLNEYINLVNNGLSENVVLFLMGLAGVAVIILVSSLFETTHLNHESVKTQIYRYELCYINKAIENHISNIS